jgi:drug/metabolite transporter (DMT)-like permease
VMVLLAVRFLAELGMLVCLCIGGWQFGESLLASIVLGVVLPLVAAVVWGRWVAPRASRRLRDPGRLGVEVTLFVAALLAVMGAHPSPAMAVFGLAVWVAFLASIPSRRHEVVRPRPVIAQSVD